MVNLPNQLTKRNILKNMTSRSKLKKNAKKR